MISTGEVVEIVLDVVHVSDDRGEWERVLVQGVFPRHAQHPDPPAGTARNVVQVFFGRDMRHVSAFLIPSQPVAHDTATTEKRQE